MKFGNQLEKQRQSMKEDWSANCIDYSELKAFLKSELIDLNDLPVEGNFSEFMTTKLERLASATPQFLKRLESQINRLNSFYLKQCAVLTERYELLKSSKSDNSNYQGLMNDLIYLEQFVYLNFTGICKILKKHDRMAGIKLMDKFLHSLTGMDFYRSSGGLIELQQLLASRLNVSDTNTMPHSVVSNKHRGSNSGLLIEAPHSITNWIPPAALLSSQIVLISLSGPHGTDIMGCLMSCLAKHEIAVIKDLTFSRLYHNVTCAALVKLSADCGQLLEALAVEAKRWEAELKFEVYPHQHPLPCSLEEAPYENRSKYTATVMNPSGLTPRLLDSWTRLLLNLKISVESTRRLNQSTLCVIEQKLSVRGVLYLYIIITLIITRRSQVKLILTSLGQKCFS